MSMTIVIDSRERRPYSFGGSTETGILPVGDYSLSGFENHIAVERKELNDLIRSLSTDRGRFEKELKKSESMPYFALVIEASLSDLADGSYRSRMNPRSVIQSLLAFSVRYRLPIFFCENREYAQRLTESLLLWFWKEIQETEGRLIEFFKEEVIGYERNNKSEAAEGGSALVAG